MPTSIPSAALARKPAFSRTRWSIVLDLQHPGADGAQRSLLDLCQRYWYPVFAYIRRCGHCPETANDMAQAFFGQLTQVLKEIDPRSHGRFRNFLVQQLHRFLTVDWRKEMGKEAREFVVAPLTVEQLERRLQADHGGDASPEQFFMRSFALEVLDRSLRRLRIEAQQSGREEMFEVLQPFLTREPVPGQYHDLSAALHLPPLVLTLAIRRLRQRFRELADDELMETVASPDDLDAERNALIAVLAQGQ